MENQLKRVERVIGIAAAALFMAAVAGFGAVLEGYAQARHPVALLGAAGIPNALAFNLLAFVLPGALAAWVALRLRMCMHGSAGWALRIGCQCVLLSALAFVAMGLLPLDPQDLESETGRWHGTAWMGWCVAFVPGAALVGMSLLRRPAWRGFAVTSLMAAIVVVLAAFVLPDAMPAGIAQRIAFGTWLVWVIAAGRIRPG